MTVWLFSHSLIAHANPSFPQPIDVLIDAGHGGIDGGTSYGSLLEKDINLKMAKILYELLSERGHCVALNRTGDYALSDENQWFHSFSRHRRDLVQRKYLAAELVPQLMLSLHVNYSSHPEARGPVVLYQKSTQSYLFADILQHSLNKLFGTSKEPVRGSTFYLLKQRYCPTVIVEMGFISNARDREFLTQPEKQRKLAEAICQAVDEYFLLVGKPNERQWEEEPTWFRQIYDWIRKSL